MNGGATLYADLDQLLAWFAAAQPGRTGAGGAWVRWASGAKIDPAHPAARQVAEWAGLGAVERRETASTFEIRKASGRQPSAEGAAFAPDGVAGRMLALLRQAQGGTRPSYREMADALGLRNRMAARHLFRKLERSGVISADSS